MNKKLVILSILIILLLPVASRAINFTAEPGREAIDIKGFISAALSVLWWVFLGLVVVLFLIAGLLFLTAAGDTAKLEKARKAAIYAIIGVIIALLGYFALATVNNLINPPGDGGGGDGEGTMCGDGSMDPGEECDDGNTANGDGCSSTCFIEAGGNNGGGNCANVGEACGANVPCCPPVMCSFGICASGLISP